MIQNNEQWESSVPPFLSLSLCLLGYLFRAAAEDFGWYCLIQTGSKQRFVLGLPMGDISKQQTQTHKHKWETVWIFGTSTEIHKHTHANTLLQLYLVLIYAWEHVCAPPVLFIKSLSCVVVWCNDLLVWGDHNCNYQNWWQKKSD